MSDMPAEDTRPIDTLGSSEMSYDNTVKYDYSRYENMIFKFVGETYSYDTFKAVGSAFMTIGGDVEVDLISSRIIASQYGIRVDGGSSTVNIGYGAQIVAQADDSIGVIMGSARYGILINHGTLTGKLYGGDVAGLDAYVENTGLMGYDNLLTGVLAQHGVAMRGNHGRLVNGGHMTGQIDGLLAKDPTLSVENYGTIDNYKSNPSERTAAITVAAVVDAAVSGAIPVTIHNTVSGYAVGTIGSYNDDGSTSVAIDAAGLGALMPGEMTAAVNVTNEAVINGATWFDHDSILDNFGSITSIEADRGIVTTSSAGVGYAPEEVVRSGGLVYLKGNGNTITNEVKGILLSQINSNSPYIIEGEKDNKLINKGEIKINYKSADNGLYPDVFSFQGDYINKDGKFFIQNDGKITLSADGTKFSPFDLSIINLTNSIETREDISNTGEIRGGIFSLGGGNDSIANSGLIASGGATLSLSFDGNIAQYFNPIRLGAGQDKYIGNIDKGTSRVAGQDLYSHEKILHLGIVSGGDGNDILWGGLNNDALMGDRGDDSISGGGGHNFLVGGDGSDTITAGSGQDDIVFDQPLALIGDDLDHIRDFDPSQDRINLDSAIFKGLSVMLVGYALKDDSFVVGPAATAPHAQIVVDPNTGIFGFDPDGAGAAPIQELAVFENYSAIGSQLKASNFYAHVFTEIFG